ncbi:MAG: peptidylprolyl isomerase [Candidatus Bathyarchaeota archaeon]|nr:peptidylprolyl isomerase [Candidatus Bathyarchaeota archaeon]
MAPKKNQRKPPPPKPKARSHGKQKSNRNLHIALGIIIIAVILVGAFVALSILDTPAAVPPTKVLLQTTAGNITIDLRTDKPITSGNFIKLVNAGIYDNTTFYRTVSGFMIQGGLGTGNVATIKDEIGTNNHNVNYTIAMAKTSQANSASSEFFINVGDNSDTTFDKTYTVFGNVISGQDVCDKIANAPATVNPNMPYEEISLPVNPVTIIKASIVP